MNGARVPGADDLANRQQAYFEEQRRLAAQREAAEAMLNLNPKGGRKMRSHRRKSSRKMRQHRRKSLRTRRGRSH